MKRETKAILVLGGTSRMGAHVIDAALGNGLRVTVLARNPEKIQNRMEQPNLEILKGDVTCFPDVYNAVQGNDAIINVLGYDGADGDIITRGTANIIAAVAKSKIQKTICLSSFGVGSTELHSSWLFRALVRLRGMQQLFQAKALQELQLYKSKIDFTLVMTGTLADNLPSRECFAYSTNNLPCITGIPKKIERSKVAKFMLGQLDSNGWTRNTVCLLAEK